MFLSLDKEEGILFQLFVWTRSTEIICNDVFAPLKLSSAIQAWKLGEYSSTKRDALTDQDKVIDAARLLFAHTRAVYQGERVLVSNGCYMRNINAQEFFGRERPFLRENRKRWPTDRVQELVRVIADSGFTPLSLR